MCGIAGIVEQHDLEAIGAMTGALAHRGPDGEGFFLRRGVALGHRRLAVIDLVTGQQPMSTPDGRFTIVFNGEIYNFRELRQALSNRGVCFRTRSDTEVLLQAYVNWGPAALDRLRGMFAFAIWDDRERHLFAARDRLGVKPLYYAETAGGLLFASEIKGLLAHPQVPREIDPCSLDDFLTYLYVPAPNTIFRGIRELPPAHWLEWRDGRILIQRYWDVKFEPEPQSLSECIEELRHLLQEAVGVRLVSDVPLGIFLSGGLDSSTVAALMARQMGEPPRAFTLGFHEGGNRYNEWTYARSLVETIGAQGRELIIGTDALLPTGQLLGATTRHFDEPFGNPTALVVYQLSAAARSHATVALAGDGGDELFLGYPRYRGTVLAQHYRRMVPTGLRRFIARATAGISEPGNGNHFSRRVREFLGGSCQALEQMYFEWISYFSHDLRQSLYSAELRQRLADYDSSQFLMQLFRQADTRESIDRINYVDLRSFLPYNVLRYTDRMSMAHALEIRSPLIDHKIIEFLATVPWRYKLRGNESKFLLRQAARRWLPKRVVHRKKLGLNPPMGLWLRGRLRPLLQEYLSAERVRARGYFRPEVVETLIRDHLSGYRDNSLHLWALISFEEWNRQYLDTKPDLAKASGVTEPFACPTSLLA